MMATVADETMQEFEWLMQYNLHPAVVCEALGKTPGAVAKFLWRRGDDRWHIFDVEKRYVARQKES